LLHETVGFSAQRLMELEGRELTGGADVERGPYRLVQRNGYQGRLADAGCHGRTADTEIVTAPFES
jgi:hypothetical protein